MNISRRQPGAWCSLFIAGTVEPRTNHHFLNAQPIGVTRGGYELEVVVLCGIDGFFDADGEPVTPVGYISKQEFFVLNDLLGGVDEEGNERPRRLFREWGKIDVMVIAMRKLQAAERDHAQALSWVPEEHKDAANLAISMVLGDDWTLDNLSEFSSHYDVEDA